MANISAHADTQRQEAAARRLPRADGLQRWTEHKIIAGHRP